MGCLGFEDGEEAWKEWVIVGKRVKKERFMCADVVLGTSSAGCNCLCVWLL